METRQVSSREVVCDVCGAPAAYVNNQVIYGSSLGSHPYVWYCENCESSVGVHPGTDLPLGKLADQDTRQSRRAAHMIFDGVWKGENARFQNRSEAYRWLAKVMDISPKDCHIGQMNSEQCYAVIGACTALLVSKEQE